MRERAKMSDMAFLKVLSCTLIFIVVAPFIDAQLLKQDIDVTPPQYNIQFALYIDDDIFTGEYNASIYIARETQDIYFDTENLSIIKTTVTHNTQIPKRNEEIVFAHTPKKLTEDIERNITIISYPYNLSSGFYTLNVKFSGFIAKDGGFRIYKNKQNDRMWLAATHYHTFATRRLFPLLKDARYASYNISIKHPKSYTAISNMPVQKQNVDENNMQWTLFNTTPLMPAYFIAATVANLTVISKSPITKLWCRTDIIPHMQFAYAVATHIAQFLDNVFLNIRKSSETNHIVIQKLLGEEDIKFGFVLYGEEDIIYERKVVSEIRKIEIIRVIGYKVVHEWFYNEMDPYKWKPWLMKGLATFFGIYIADKLFPFVRIKDFSVVRMQHDVLHWSTKNTWPLTNKSEFNSIEIPHYIKGSIMFRMLQILFTKEMFENGIKMYLRDHYSSSKDFWDIMQLVMDRSSFEIKYNVMDRMASWTELNYYPVINVKRNYNNNRLNILVENFDTDIWIYVNIITQAHFDSKKLLSEVWLAPHISYHTLNIDFMDKNDWVLVNLQQTGCYRVYYDAENWNRLSKYLNHSFEKIHVLDRAKIIDDAFHFMMTGQLNFNVFLNISHYLSQDMDYIAWYPMFKDLEYISGFFAFPESLFIKAEIMQFVKKILWKLEYPTFDQDEFNYGSTFSKCLRQEAAKLLCLVNFDSCLLISNVELKSYLSYRNTLSSYKIWTDWKEWTFCCGLKRADNDTWMQVFDIYLKESDSSVLKFLSCSQKTSIILQYIHLMTNMTKVTAIDHINSFCTIIARHARTTLLQFILDHLEEIKPKEISLTKALIMIINHVYSEQQINEIKKYINFNIKSSPEFTISYKFDNDDQNNDMIDGYVLFNDKMESTIMYINRKIELRWHQIRTQLHEYRYLIGEYGDTSKASW